MVSITYTSLTTLVNDSSIAAATAENIIDQAINKLNGYGTTLSNLTGVAGAKTGTYTSAEAGWILEVAMEFYQYYKTAGASATSVGISGLSYSTSTSQGNAGLSRATEMAKVGARQLLGRNLLRT